jgi:DAACS family dicarboxylate/amino acid:cation (Na+ or H+) symporter
MPLWLKIIIAMATGLCVGLFLGPQAQILKPIGQIFLNLINMIVVLLVLSSMTLGITSIHDPKKLGRVGLKSVVIYLVTTVIAISLGIIGAAMIEPGSGLQLAAVEGTETVLRETPALSAMFLNAIPSNPVAAMAEGNVIQIIVFAVFLGMAINLSGERGRPILEFFESLADVMGKMTSLILEFSPYGVFAIMAAVAGSFGLAVLLPLAKFLGLYYIVCAVHMLVVYCGMLWFLGRLSPWPFFRGMGDAISVAFSTCSSSATLPVSMHCVQQNLGVSKNMTNFIMPLGTSINTNGAALFQAMAALFVAQAYGINLDFQNIITIVVAATMASVGAAGIPGTGLIMSTVVFNSVGLPIEGLALLAGIDRLREMVSTVVNILGDSVVAVYIAKQEGELDERQYYHEALVEIESTES